MIVTSAGAGTERQLPTEMRLGSGVATTSMWFNHHRSTLRFGAFRSAAASRILQLSSGALRATGGYRFGTLAAGDAQHKETPAQNMRAYLLKFCRQLLVWRVHNLTTGRCT